MVQDFKKLELSMSQIPVVSQMVPDFSMAPELSPEMSQAPGSLLPAPARDQSLFMGHWAQAACGVCAGPHQPE